MQIFIILGIMGFALFGTILFGIWLNYMSGDSLFPIPTKFIYYIGKNDAINGIYRRELLEETKQRKKIYDIAYDDFRGKENYKNKMKKMRELKENKTNNIILENRKKYGIK